MDPCEEYTVSLLDSLKVRLSTLRVHLTPPFKVTPISSIYSAVSRPILVKILKNDKMTKEIHQTEVGTLPQSQSSPWSTIPLPQSAV